MQQGWYRQNINCTVASVRSPWCLCVLSGCRAGIWVPRGSAGCRSRWWTRCFSEGPIWTSAAQTDSLDEGKKHTKSRDNRFTEDFLKTIPETRNMLHKRFGERPFISSYSCSLVWIKFHSYICSYFYKNITGLTSRHLLHEDLYEAVLAEGSEVLDDVLVL